MSYQTPLLFVDRDGTLVAEPDDFQLDSYAKLRFIDGVIPALLRLRDAGYRMVMVSNQDGLGTAAFPQTAFDGPQQLMLQVFASQGIVFDEILIDASVPADRSPNRKPGVGMVLHLMRRKDIDWARSAMVGDRDTDVAFAGNLGIRAFQLRSAQFGGDADWADIAHALCDAPRVASVERATSETHVAVRIDLDRLQAARASTGLGFFDHMLEQFGRHAGISLEISCNGDLQVDEHHSVEDCALALGQALREALGEKRGIQRFGFVLPMDDALAAAALDLSGRALLVFRGGFARDYVGDLPTELVPHFFRSLCDAAGVNLHLSVEGDNDHHKVEACFKAVARALRQALRREGSEVPSTKGVL